MKRVRERCCLGLWGEIEGKIGKWGMNEGMSQDSAENEENKKEIAYFPA